MRSVVEQIMLVGEHKCEMLSNALSQCSTNKALVKLFRCLRFLFRAWAPPCFVNAPLGWDAQVDHYLL